MPIEGIQQNANQQLMKPQKNNLTIPKEIDMPGTAKNISVGGLTSYVIAGLNEIMADFQQKLRDTKKRLSDELLSILGLEGEENGEMLGGLKTIKKGLREILRNFRFKKNNGN